MTDNKIIKRMRELMYDNEWTPNFNSSKWKREQDYWIYTGNYSVKYEVTNNLIRDMEKYNNLFEQLKNKELARQFYEFNDNVQKFYLISKIGDSRFYVGMTNTSILYTLKLAICNYLREMISNLNLYPNLDGVSIEIILMTKDMDLSRLALIRRTKENLSDQVIIKAKINPNLICPQLAEKYMNYELQNDIYKNIKKTNYFIYKLTDDIKISKKDPGKYLEKVRTKSQIIANIIHDYYVLKYDIGKFNFLNNFLVNWIYSVKDVFHFNRRIFMILQNEIFLNEYNDTFNYNNIDSYIYSIEFENKYFFGLEEQNKYNQLNSLKLVINYIYNTAIYEQKNAINKLARMLETTPYYNINIKIVDYRENGSKKDLYSKMKNLMMKYNSIDNGYNISYNSIYVKIKANRRQ